MTQWYFLLDLVRFYGGGDWTDTACDSLLPVLWFPYLQVACSGEAQAWIEALLICTSLFWGLLFYGFIPLNEVNSQQSSESN